MSRRPAAPPAARFATARPDALAKLGFHLELYHEGRRPGHYNSLVAQAGVAATLLQTPILAAAPCLRPESCSASIRHLMVRAVATSG
jgi:hypothetical protein